MDGILPESRRTDFFLKWLNTSFVTHEERPEDCGKPVEE
jgi:hypothetical protein